MAPEDSKSSEGGVPVQYAWARGDPAILARIEEVKQWSDGGVCELIHMERHARFYAEPHTMLDRLQHQGILSVCKQGPAEIRITKACDGYFSVVLTKPELSQLITELMALRDAMKESSKGDGR